LGIYTGKLIGRAAAEILPDEHRGYLFDLDSMERDDDVDDDAYLYSVDSYECGNWTRFINHSCDPNTRVYPVYYDTVPEMNQPYLAFVATKDIPAHTEFTLSYNPAASAALAKGKKKGKKKILVDGLPCHCSAKTCLGRR
jgi:histone-lysine N-methyltransferase SUV39H